MNAEMGIAIIGSMLCLAIGQTLAVAGAQPADKLAAAPGGEAARPNLVLPAYLQPLGYRAGVASLSTLH